MSKLIAGEMSKDVEDIQSSSNVVAKLMGLETVAPRSRSRCSVDYHRRGFEDGYRTLDLPSRLGICDGSMSDNKHLDLVRRKLHRSKEFQEALEVLSSNKDLFVKLLQESNSLLFSQHKEAKRITVLRPLKAVDAQKCVVQDGRSKRVKKLNQETKRIDAAEPTRIVVLKPSTGKALDTKAIASSLPPSCFDEAGDAETREVAKEITRQIRESFKGHCRNETLSSSDSCNGSVGDSASLSRLNNEYPVGNISNSETISPSSRHSWDCGNRLESPCSSSSLSQVSFSPESSVYIEAKKRLSERWATVSLNGDVQKQKDFPKASTALGDMLEETKVPARSNEERNKAKPDTRRSVSCIGSGLDQVESTNGSLNTLERSKSVPESRLNGGTSVSGTSKSQAARALTESRGLKSSWKVSSLFFFRNKRANKEKTDVPMYRSISQLAILSDAPKQQSISPREQELLNQDQPSPVSVLHPPFDEEYVENVKCSGTTKPWITQGEEMSLKSNLIDKSPPIESIARVLSWENESYTDITNSGTGIKEDEDWYDFIKTLLKESGFSSSDPLMTRWHSPDSPLDPSLRDQFANKELIKRRKHQSNRNLVFDCINAIIAETTSTATRTDLAAGFDMVEHVWSEFKDWVAHDSNSLEVESVARDEVVGKMWTRNLQLEANNLEIEIEMLLLQELVEEAVFNIT